MSTLTTHTLLVEGSGGKGEGMVVSHPFKQTVLIMELLMLYIHGQA